MCVFTPPFCINCFPILQSISLFLVICIINKVHQALNVTYCIRFFFIGPFSKLSELRMPTQNKPHNHSLKHRNWVSRRMSIEHSTFLMVFYTYERVFELWQNEKTGRFVLFFFSYIQFLLLLQCSRRSHISNRHDKTSNREIGAKVGNEQKSTKPKPKPINRKSFDRLELLLFV